MAGLQSLYRQLLIQLSVEQSFDALPTPYRAVAMDLSTGEAVALDSGDLVEAMLASMAVPGVFAPRKVNGRTLVDVRQSNPPQIDFGEILQLSLLKE